MSPASGCLAFELRAHSGLIDIGALRPRLDVVGRLVVDEMLSEATMEPVWVYERGPSPPAKAEP